MSTVTAKTGHPSALAEFWYYFSRNKGAVLGLAVFLLVLFVAAFAPIVEPSTAHWSVDAFEKYLGPDRAAWRKYDACALVKDGHRFPEFLIDQGKADSFLENGLRPWLFEEAVKDTDIKLTLRMHERYDHSYYFISTFMDDHLRWHAERLGA